jgi:hypothetical protein
MCKLKYDSNSFGNAKNICSHAGMSELRIRIKLGEHEIELEGSVDAVERQFEPFKLLLIPQSPLASVQKDSADIEEQTKAPSRLPLEKIIRVHDDIYSLSVNAKLEDAILVILLAQRTFRQNENVSGVEIMKGLRSSGFRVSRVDTILNRYFRLAQVVPMGQHRRRRYRLSLDGLQRAEQIARTLIAQLPPPEPSATVA